MFCIEQLVKPKEYDELYNQTSTQLHIRTTFSRVHTSAKNQAGFLAGLVTVRRNRDTLWNTEYVLPAFAQQ